MNEKNVNRLSTILTVIGIILFVVSCVKTLQTAKVYTALQQEISKSVEVEKKILEGIKQKIKQAEEIFKKSEQEAKRSEELAEESKQKIKQAEEILKIHAAALDRNTAVYERLIQLLEDLTQD